MAQPSVIRVLLCRLSTCVIGLPLEHVIETMRPLAVEPVSATPLPFVKGLSMIRGMPVPVLDTALLLGAQTSAFGRFVTVRTGARTVALAFDEVLDVRSVRTESLQELPPLLQQADAEVVTAIGTLHAELLVILSTARLIPAGIELGGDATAGSL